MDFQENLPPRIDSDGDGWLERSDMNFLRMNPTQRRAVLGMIAQKDVNLAGRLGRGEVKVEMDSLIRLGYLPNSDAVNDNTHHQTQELNSDITLNNERNEGTNFTRTLNIGKTGSDVQTLQRILTSLGFNTQGIDGIFGPDTQRALVTYQQQILSQSGDGIMDLGGPTMRSLLRNTLSDGIRSGSDPEVDINLDQRVGILDSIGREVLQARGRMGGDKRISIQNQLRNAGITDTEVIETATSSMVSIYAGGGSGSGAFIAPNIIITAKHVLEEEGTLGGNIEIVNSGNVTMVPNDVWLSPTEDIAFIRVSETNPNYLNIFENGNIGGNNNTAILGMSNENPRISGNNITGDLAERTDIVAEVFQGSDGDIDNDGIINSDDWEFNRNRSRPGDSGGLLIGSDGNVEGITIRGYGNSNIFSAILGYPNATASIMESTSDIRREYSRYLNS